MPTLGGPLAACALLLVLGGVTKVGRPHDTARALRTLRLPATSTAVRLLALAEAAIGVVAILLGGRMTASMMAVSYIGFSCFVALAMVRHEALSSCGCFGTPDTPPTITHLMVTLSAGAVAAAAVVHPVGALLDDLATQPLLGVPFILLTACCAWLGYAALAVLPRTTPFIRRRG